MRGKHKQVLLCAATLLQNQIGRQQGASNARVATMTPLQKKRKQAVLILNFYPAAPPLPPPLQRALPGRPWRRPSRR
jgi:hypothetical protein